MQLSNKVRKILGFYDSENPGVKSNLARILMNGVLGGTGKLLILPVDQGFEHGPIKSFAPNVSAYDPLYHFQLAIDAGLSAYAAPLGMVEAGASTYAGSIPLILKVNSSNALSPKDSVPDQVITSSVQDALRLGCSAIGLTIYPGSHQCFSMISEIRDMIAEAKSFGLAVVIWSYPRGADLSKKAETAIDIISYAAHMAALLGANIVKVKPPTNHVEKEKISQDEIDTLTKRISYVKRACFAGRRLVVFSGGEPKDSDSLYQDIESIRDGGGDGSIIGRNTFQRPREEALSMLSKIMDCYTMVNS